MAWKTGRTEIEISTIYGIMKNQIIIVMQGGLIEHIAASDLSIVIHVVDHDRKQDEGFEYDASAHFKPVPVDIHLEIEPVEYIKYELGMDDETYNQLNHGK